jgi:hypothetical protein
MIDRPETAKQFDTQMDVEFGSALSFLAIRLFRPFRASEFEIPSTQGVAQGFVVAAFQAENRNFLRRDARGNISSFFPTIAKCRDDLGFQWNRNLLDFRHNSNSMAPAR